MDGYYLFLGSVYTCTYTNITILSLWLKKRNAGPYWLLGLARLSQGIAHALSIHTTWTRSTVTADWCAQGAELVVSGLAFSTAHYMSDRMPENMPDGMPENMSESMSDRMPDGMPDRLPDNMSKYMPDRMPEYMSDKMQT